MPRAAAAEDARGGRRQGPRRHREAARRALRRAEAAQGL